MSDWIRVHAQLVARPVVARCAEALRIDPYKAVGHLVTFWGAVAEHARGGHVGDVPDALLERWAGWTGKRGAFARWLRADHVDPQGRVNQWDEYQGKLEHRRELERQRIANKREMLRNTSPTVAQPLQDVATRARERDGTERNEELTTLPAATREDVGQSLTAAQRLVIAANQAIERRWGEQVRPLLPGHGPTVQLVADLTQAGVPIEFACASITRQVEGKGDGPPRSMGYFRPGLLEDWQAAETRALAADTPAVAPLTAVTRPARRETGFLAAVIRGEA